METRCGHARRCRAERERRDIGIACRFLFGTDAAPLALSLREFFMVGRLGGIATEDCRLSVDESIRCAGILALYA